MQRKYKMTGCARFFLVMIILAPIAYLGAAYYNDENGIGNLKRLVGIEKSEIEYQETENEETQMDLNESDTLENVTKEGSDEMTINQLRDHISELEKEIEKLKKQLEEKTKNPE